MTMGRREREHEGGRSQRKQPSRSEHVNVISEVWIQFSSSSAGCHEHQYFHLRYLPNMKLCIHGMRSWENKKQKEAVWKLQSKGFLAVSQCWEFKKKKERVQSPPRMRASGKYPSLAESPRELNCKRRGTRNRWALGNPKPSFLWDKRVKWLACTASDFQKNVEFSLQESNSVYNCFY